MNVLEWSDEEVHDWLRQFSLLLDDVVQKGSRSTREDIVELLMAITSFNEGLQQSGRFTQNVTTLKVAQELLSAALVQHDRNEQHDNPVVSETNSSPISSTSDASDKSVPSSSCEAVGTTVKEELDSFSSSRRQAIESTIVANLNDLPSLSEIVGLEEAKTALFEALVDPIHYSEYFSTSDLRPWKTVLLYGPPGTGKSALSQAIVREIESQLYQVSSSDLISTWSGQSERLIRELFDHALALKKTAIIFIDEVDSLCRTRCASEDDANRRVKTELLVQMQRLQSSSNLVLVCATNCPWDLDPAFMRRFEKKIYIGLPDLDARLTMLRRRLQRMAKATDGFSGDDIRRFATELAYTQFRYYKAHLTDSELEVRPALSSSDVEKVLNSFSKSVEEHQLARYLQYNNR
ncbi:hypothetical protein Q1695_012963 [Nippostrongylus brasiliensis]|nr:hypothetical protein Q1695_012963 [Nippostrongylus brasiliensis]